MASRRSQQAGLPRAHKQREARRLLAARGAQSVGIQASSARRARWPGACSATAPPPGPPRRQRPLTRPSQPSRRPRSKHHVLFDDGEEALLDPAQADFGFTSPPDPAAVATAAAAAAAAGPAPNAAADVGQRLLVWWPEEGRAEGAWYGCCVTHVLRNGCGRSECGAAAGAVCGQRWQAVRHAMRALARHAAPSSLPTQPHRRPRAPPAPYSTHSPRL